MGISIKLFKSIVKNQISGFRSNMFFIIPILNLCKKYVFTLFTGFIQERVRRLEASLVTLEKWIIAQLIFLINSPRLFIFHGEIFRTKCRGKKPVLVFLTSCNSAPLEQINRFNKEHETWLYINYLHKCRLK